MLTDLYPTYNPKTPSPQPYVQLRQVCRQVFQNFRDYDVAIVRACVVRAKRAGEIDIPGEVVRYLYELDRDHEQLQLGQGGDAA